MTDPAEVLAGGLPSISPFGPASRYTSQPITDIEIDGITHRYVTRRFTPDPDALAVIGEHVVVGGDRPDNLAASELGDPQLFWRLCDANGAVFADELVERVGRRLRIALPEGIPGAPGA